MATETETPPLPPVRPDAGSAAGSFAENGRSDEGFGFDGGFSPPIGGAGGLDRVERASTGADPFNPNEFFRVPAKDELEYRKEEFELRRQQYADYRDGVLRAKEGAVRRDYVDVGPVVLHEKSKDYLAFRYTATTLPAKGGAPFDTTTFPAFDAAVARAAGIDALNNPENQDYENYTAMRMNIAVVRNIIYNQYFADGRFNKTDKCDASKREHLLAMAKSLGTAIANNEFFDNIPLIGDALNAAHHLPKNFGNIPDEGAARMYRYLYDKQNSQLFSGWGLLPPEQTAISQQSLDEFYNATADLQGLEGRLSDFLIQRAEETREVALRLADRQLSPDDLSESDKRASIVEAEKILRYFKVQYQEASLGVDGKQLGSEDVGEDHLPQENINITNSVAALTKQYEGMLCQLLSKRGGWDEEMLAIHHHATNTIGEMAWALSRRAQLSVMLEVGDPKADEKIEYLNGTFACDNQGNPLPDRWTHVNNDEKQPLLRMVSALMDDIRAVDARMRAQGVDQSGVGQGIAQTGMSRSLSSTSDAAAQLAMAGMVPPDQQHIFANAVAAIKAQQEEGARMVRSGVVPTKITSSPVKSILAAKNNSVSSSQTTQAANQSQMQMANLSVQQQQQFQQQPDGNTSQQPTNSAQQQQQQQEQQQRQQLAQEMRAERQLRRTQQQMRQQQQRQNTQNNQQANTERRNASNMRTASIQNRLRTQRVNVGGMPQPIANRIDGNVGATRSIRPQFREPTNAFTPVIESVADLTPLNQQPGGGQLPPRINRNTLNR